MVERNDQWRFLLKHGGITKIMVERRTDERGNDAQDPCTG